VIVRFQKTSIIYLLLASICFSFQIVENLTQIPILTPSFAERQIAKLRLDNGLEAYLISDPHMAQSAAALSVEVGFWNDLEQYPGIAHFVEHMLFMGSSAYPQENEYTAFIRDQGGSDNAFTSADRTLYVFSVNNNAMPEALDRFAHFFIDPLFSPSSMSREIHAIDEEYALIKEKEYWRKWMVFKETGNAHHPNASFSVGNYQTLKDMPQSTLLEWYQKYYSARYMHLALISPLPLDTLIELVDHSFSAITNSTTPLSHCTDEICSIDQKGAMIYVDSDDPDPQLELIWEIPLNDQVNEISKVIALALEHPLKKSLSHVLKEASLAKDLTLSLSSVSKNHFLFTIQIDLTELGLTKIDQIIFHCFQALSEIKTSSIPRYLYDEMTHLNRISYQYPSRYNAFDTVLFHADNLIQEKLETYPEQTLLFSEYNSEKIQEFVKKLEPDTCIYMVIGDFHLGENLKKEKWIGVPYELRPIDPDTMTLWKEAMPHPNITYPPPNPYLSTPLLTPSESETPIHIINNDSQGLFYFQQDNHYLVPQAASIFNFYSPLFNKNAQSQMLLSLFIQAFDEETADLCYLASRAGISSLFLPKSASLYMRVHGYSDQFPLFLKQIIAKLTTTSCSQEEFEKYRESLLTILYRTSSPIEEAKLLFYTYLFPTDYTLDEKIEALEEISYEEFLFFLKNIFISSYVEGLLYGNLTLSAADSLWQELKHELPTSTHPFYKPKAKHPLIPENKMTIIEIEMEEEGNAALLALYQGKFSLESRSSQQILSLAIQEAFFDTLRTKQQTGYEVHSWNERIEEDLFQFFSVTSNHYTPKDLLKRFEQFIQNYKESLAATIPPSRFDTLRYSLIASLKAPAENLKKQAQELHYLATRRKGNFKWYLECIEALEKLTYNQFLTFATETLSKELPRIAVLVNSSEQ